MVDPDRSGAATPELELSLLSGFGFSCLPGCGLCCFASPRLGRDEEARLRALAPNMLVVVAEGERRIAERPDGGACQFLTELRCGVHTVRPAPCREFPISVHIGTRLQATVVLSCPGLGLEPLSDFGRPGQIQQFKGLDGELSSVRQRLTPAVERRRTDALRRRRRLARELETQGRWVDEDEVRRRFAGHPLIPRPSQYSPQELPAAELGLERLPLFYDGRSGPVALADGVGGIEALELSPEGGGKTLDLVVPPDQLPSVDARGESLLSGYLRYWLARDCFLAAVHLEMQSISEGDVVEVARHDLLAIASDVLARSAIRAKLNGKDGTRLTRPDIELGIRAVDQDWLDRPTWGSRL